MKNILSLILILVSATAGAGAVPCERIFISTDRNFYAAGENVYCSAFCLNEKNEMSDFSSVAYVELYNGSGMVASAKIGLSNGLGAGVLEIPSGIPTGNYHIAAYTAIDKNIPGFDFDSKARTLSIYNVASVKKADPVTITDENPVRRAAPEHGLLSITEGYGLFRLLSPYADACVSVSVFKDEGLPDYNGTGIYGFVNDADSYESYTANVVPEYDGEIIYAKISALDGTPMSGHKGTDVYIGCPGNNEDLYAATLDDEGNATFFTSNIYGEKDMAVMLKEQAGAWKVDFASPYVGLTSADIPALELSSGMKAAVERLGVASQITKAFEKDSIYSRQPVRNLPFLGKVHYTYKLDDYTRFRTMKEVFTEILGGVSLRSQGRENKIFIRCEGNFNQIPNYRPNAALVIIDGVPVLNHDLILGYDPLLVRSIDVYPHEYSFGTTIYAGVLSLTTYKGDMTGFKFGDNVKIISFKGISYPISFSNASFPSNYPALRQTLYWMPSVRLEAGKAFFLDFIVPDRPGSYIIKVEGLSSERKPLYKEYRFTVS